MNTLYLALGMLSWKEEENSDKFCRAPLILIPTELDRSDARDRFHLKFSGEEFAENVSLAERLKQASASSYPPLTEPDDLDVADYFRKVARSVAGQHDWRIDSSAIALGFFSFAKFLMYRGCDSATWPTTRYHRWGTSYLENLLGEDGFPGSSFEYREDCLLDEQVQGREVFHVVDADSSQSDSYSGQPGRPQYGHPGPAGDGQITEDYVNLIAGAVAQGKRVLFVSEKMAALDVVKRRLDRAKLGAACRNCIAIERTRRPLSRNFAEPRSANGRLLLHRDRSRPFGGRQGESELICKAVNEPIGASGVTPCNIYGKLLSAEMALKGLDLPAAVQLEGAETWPAEDAARRSLLVNEVQDRVASCGVPQSTPLLG